MNTQEHWSKQENYYKEKWIQVTFLQQPEVGDDIAWCDGFGWREQKLTEKMRDEGWWMTGVHNETTSFINPAFGKMYFRKAKLSPRTSKVNKEELAEQIAENYKWNESDFPNFNRRLGEAVFFALLAFFFSVVALAISIAF